MHADLVILGGRLRTVDRTCPRAEALAIRGGRIAAIGTAAELATLVGPRTELLELDGETVLPGFQDAHIHLAHGGWETLACSLYASSGPDEHARIVAAFAQANPDAPWIRGAGWSMDDFGGPMPTAAFLDTVVPDRPVFLLTRDAHTAWVNTRALELAGVSATTSDPPGGVIDRDGTGAPTGTLQENAMRLVSDHLPPVPQADWEEGIRRGQLLLHSLGITACQEASLDAELWAPYVAVAGRGELTLRVEASLWWDDTRGDEQLEELVQRRAAGSVGRLRMRGAKLFQDGVVESWTAAMLDAYRAGPARGTNGVGLYEPDRLQDVVTTLDAHGFQVQIHAIGDRAVRESLDAIQRAQSVNGARDARHHLAHVQFAHPDDLARFAGLDVTANVTPYWALRSGYVEDLTLPFVSEAAAASMYPFGSIARAGGRLAFGSDWSVSTPDPLLQLEVAVERRRPGHEDDPILLPDERLSLDAAIEAATLGAASVNHLDDVTGSLTVGKLADVAILDRDLDDRGSGAIGDARVRLTLVEGAVVFEA